MTLRADDNWDNEEFDDGPLEQDLAAGDDDADLATVPCARCGFPTAELAEICPQCGEWRLDDPVDDRRWFRRRQVQVVLAGLLVVSFLIWSFWS